MFHVQEKENGLLKECFKALNEEDRRLYLYGCGKTAAMFLDILQMHQIPVTGFLCGC